MPLNLIVNNLNAPRQTSSDKLQEGLRPVASQFESGISGCAVLKFLKPTNPLILLAKTTVGSARGHRGVLAV